MAFQENKSSSTVQAHIQETLNNPEAYGIKISNSFAVLEDHADIEDQAGNREVSCPAY